MGRMLILASIVLGVGCVAHADVVQYTVGGTTSNVAVFGEQWDDAVTGDLWELVITVDTGIAEDDSTVADPNAFRVFDSLITASLTIGPNAAPVTMFGDDLFFTNGVDDSFFFSAFEAGGGTMSVQIDGPSGLFDELAFPTNIDQGSLGSSRFFVNAFIQGEVGIFGDAIGGSFTARVIPSPSASLALLAGLGFVARRRR